MDKNLSAEELDSDELDGDLNLSDEEDGGARREEIRQQRAAEQEESAAPRERHNVEFDTNIFKISLECLQNRGQLATGDAQFCNSCNGVFNHTSSIAMEGEQ